MSATKKFSYLSASAISRLSHDEIQEYYLNMLEFTSDQSDDQSVLGVEDDSDDDVFPGVNEDSDCEDVNEDIVAELNEDTDSDIIEEDESFSDENEQAGPSNHDYFVSKDGTKWYKNPPSLHRSKAHNIIRSAFGPTADTKNLTKVDTFKCIMSPAIIDLICRHTNKKAEEVYDQWNANHSEKKRVWIPVTSEEFMGFLGILLVTGSNLSNKESTTKLWKKNSCPLYKATMSKNRFENILRFIRFDSSRLRATRLQTQKDAAIADVFEMINSNLRAHYRPHESITVDEQLLAFRGRTKFTQYMPSKPAKYGIKIWWTCDSTTFYPLNGQIYTGKLGTVRDVNQGERVVKDLVAPYKGTGRNVTTDNFFTSLPLANELLSWKLTLVGTLKRNKRYLPEEFKPSRTRSLYSSIFGFSQNVTLVSYVPAKNRSVVLLSTMHQNNNIAGPKEKPEIIMYYNKTKGGVDAMDKMLSQYTCKRATRRWPLALFFNLVDTAALATYVIFMENSSVGSVKNSRRRLFLEQLGEELCTQHIKVRSQNKVAVGRFAIKSAIECILGESITCTEDDEPFMVDDAPERDASGRVKQKGKCYMCRETKKLRNTRQSCITYKKPVCGEHSCSQTKCEKCHMGPTTSKRSFR